MTVSDMLSGTDRKAFWRKRLLISFAMFGSIATSSFLIFPSTTPSWLPPLAGALNIIGYTAYSITVVCQNAFLPILAAEELRYGTENEPLLQDKTVLSLATSRISSICFGMGCISACIGLATLEILLIILKGTNHALQLCIGLTGLWWGVFTLPALFLPKGERSSERIGWTDGWSRTGEILKPSQIRNSPHVYRFLIAWFFLSDGGFTLRPR